MFLQVEWDEESILARRGAHRELEAAAAVSAPLPEDQATELEALRRLSKRLEEACFDVSG